VDAQAQTRRSGRVLASMAKCRLLSGVRAEINAPIFSMDLIINEWLDETARRKPHQRGSNFICGERAGEIAFEIRTNCMNSLIVVCDATHFGPPTLVGLGEMRCSLV
jgi:hypothetical protein